MSSGCGSQLWRILNRGFVNSGSSLVCKLPGLVQRFVTGYQVAFRDAAGYSRFSALCEDSHKAEFLTVTFSAVAEVSDG